MNLWDDPRIVRGMTAQFALRRQRLDGGDKLLGWKVGFGAPAQLKQFNTSGPLVGFLTQNARMAPGSTVSLAGWAKPVAEPEVAVHIGRDVAAGATPEDAAAAIAGISPAIELADLHEPPLEPERILSHDIYQRHVVLAGSTPGARGSCGRWSHLPHHAAWRGVCAHHRSAGQHRPLGRHRKPRRERARGLRRAAACRRSDHHRLGGAADRDRA